MNTAGTFRIADGSPVVFSDAKVAWTRAARPALLQVARRYHDLITYADLAEEVQCATGIRTRALMHYWIGGVLEEIALECHRCGEPLLSSLCVHADGTVGYGYGRAVVDTYGGGIPEDLDMHAAHERLACYRHFGAELPAGGGEPVLTPQVRARRARTRPVRERKVCPTCRLELPLTGQCDNCGPSP